MILIIFFQGGGPTVYAMDRRDLELIALARELTGDCYIFSYEDNDECSDAAIQVVGRFANNPDLSLTWDEAATLARKMLNLREASRKASKQASDPTSNPKPNPPFPTDTWRQPE